MLTQALIDLRPFVSTRMLTLLFLALLVAFMVTPEVVFASGSTGGTVCTGC
ncbi:MAG: hypothetical protein AAFR81_29690 [Chloroflexota bacterium]